MEFRLQNKSPRPASILGALGLLAFLALGGAASAQESRHLTAKGLGPWIEKTGLPVGFGSYDPHGNFTDDKPVKIEHLFLPWEDVDLASIFTADQYAIARNRRLLITVEPWSWSKEWRLTKSQLRAAILSGKYDNNMRAVCAIVSQLKSHVTIRWGHEMENKVGRFSWSLWRPEDYISAYRRMIGICRIAAPKAIYMWSPKGENGLEEYYPGDDFVDLIGLSVFGLQPWDNDKFGRDRTFNEILDPGYKRVLNFRKPIWVAELGYVGKQGYVDQWDDTVDNIALFKEFPELKAVVYFNDKEVHPWPDGYGYPDWRVTHHVLE